MWHERREGEVAALPCSDEKEWWLDEEYQAEADEDIPSYFESLDDEDHPHEAGD